MSGDISNQLIAQASVNIQKLFELGTRSDERLKSIQSKIKRQQEEIDELIKQQTTTDKEVAILLRDDIEDSLNSLSVQIHSCQLALVEVDKRVIMLEGAVKGSENRWEKIITFGIQLIWVVLAAWLLATFNLQAPP